MQCGERDSCSLGNLCATGPRCRRPRLCQSRRVIAVFADLAAMPGLRRWYRELQITARNCHQCGAQATRAGCGRAAPDLRGSQCERFSPALAQPLCAMMRVAEIQSPYIAEYLLGHCHLPPCMEIEHAMRSRDQLTKSPDTDSRRDTIRLDCPASCHGRRRERGRGASA